MMTNTVVTKFRRKIKKYRIDHENNKVESLLKKGAFTPIYHIHIRKTAGTTINFGFLSNSKCPDVSSFYEQLANKQNHRIFGNNKIFVGWNRELINQGKYFYAFSHLPLHELNLPKHVFKFTCFRDPANRVLSHYNMLRYYLKNNIDHPCMETEGEWLGNSFDDFLLRFPNDQMNNQIYMFSKELNVDEAFENIMKCDHFMFTEELENGLSELGSKLNVTLHTSNQKKYGYKEKITEDQLSRLKSMLVKEYELLNKLKTSSKHA